MTPLTYSILLALADRTRHGYGIIKEIEARTGDGSGPSTGALYLALQRMETEGMIEESEPPSDQQVDSRRRYWGLTRRGREAARHESERLRALVATAQEKQLLGDRV